VDDTERDALLIRLDERTFRTDKALFGNGQPGLISKVADHDARLTAFDVIYARSLAEQAPIMAEYHRLLERVDTLEEKDKAAPGAKTQKATGFAAVGALAAAIVPFILKAFGIPIPV
jgi:hypothetical protein